MELPLILLPAQPRNDEHNHANDTFRELVRCWEKEGLCRVTVYDGPHPWWGGVGQVLLYDRPTLRQLYSTLPAYELALFGNTNPPPSPADSSSTHGGSHHPWCFWARHPALLEQYLRKEPPSTEYQQRNIGTIFLGKIENQVQAQWRLGPDWPAVIDSYSMVMGAQTTYAYQGEDYLRALASARFGLTLRGFGPKCNREIELLALGTVPLITGGVDTEGYHEPLIEGVHYLRVNSPEEVPIVVRNCSPAEWQAMSLAGRDWYERNCSTRGSFLLTQKIISIQTKELSWRKYNEL